MFPTLFRAQTVEVTVGDILPDLRVGATSRISFVVRNLGEPATFQVVVADNQGFVSSVQPSSLTLDTSGKGTVDVDVTVPPETPEGTGVSISTTTTSTANPSVTNGATVDLAVSPLTVVNDELSSTPLLETFVFDPTPMEGGPAGTIAFTAQFCNVGHKRLTELKSVTTKLTGGNVLLNRDPATAPDVGSELTFPANTGYADLALDGSECVDVHYQIGLAAPEPLKFFFEFFVDVLGIASEVEEVEGTSFSREFAMQRKSRRQPSIPIRLIGSNHRSYLEGLLKER
jgi:hypothetical protein